MKVVYRVVGDERSGSFDPLPIRVYMDTTTGRERKFEKKLDVHSDDRPL